MTRTLLQTRYPTAPGSDDAVTAQIAVADDLAQSDFLYFTAGAEVSELPGSTMSWMKGLTMLAAGCVVHVIDPSQIDDPATWVSQIENEIQRVGASYFRIYLGGQPKALERELRRRGYRMTREIGYAIDAKMRPQGSAIELMPVIDDKDWELKGAIYRTVPPVPHGGIDHADHMLELERRKCEAGYMTPYLLVVDGDPCGSMSAAKVGGVMRMKNLVVLPNHRRRGAATAAVELTGHLAAGAGLAAGGLYALESGPGSLVYQKLGLRDVVQQFEWMRPAC